jgi:hypothetical protein
VTTKDFDFNSSATWICKAVVTKDFWVRLQSPKKDFDGRLLAQFFEVVSNVIVQIN